MEFSAFLESLETEDRILVAMFLDTLAKYGPDVDGRWFKTLPDDLIQVRIGPTRQVVGSRLGLSLSTPSEPMLIRIYLIESGPNIVILNGYDKEKDRSRATQQAAIRLANLRAELCKSNLAR